MTAGGRSWLHRGAFLQELNLVGFAFLLHFPLELWIMEPKLRADPHILERGEVAAVCATAAAGHAMIALLMFWVIAAAGGRRWVCGAHWAELLLFVLSTGIVTLVLEPGLGMWLERTSPHADTFANVWGSERLIPSLLQAFAVPALLVWILGRQLGPAIAPPAPTPASPTDEHVSSNSLR